MEHVTVSVDAERYDELVHGTPSDRSLPQYGEPTGGTMQIAVKPGATTGGRPALVVAFRVVTPDGRVRLVQATTTLRAFLAAVEVLRQRRDLQDEIP